MGRKPTLFVVTDIETTVRQRIMFDIAWRIIDRHGNEYAKGSFIVKEAFKHDVPFFAEKLGFYFQDVFEHLIEPASIHDIRRFYNNDIQRHQEMGHRVIGAAYNAAFDFKYMPETFKLLLGRSDVRWMEKPVELLDIWHFWGLSVPKNYSAPITNSGKFYSTSAESAYKFEFDNNNFEEAHIAWQDVLIESEILIKTLRRKKEMPVVKNPTQFKGGIYRLINQRLGVDGKETLPGFEPA